MKETIKLNIEADGLDKFSEQIEKADENAKSLKRQLREAQEEAQRLATADVVDEEKLRIAIQRAAELKDKIQEVNEQVNVMAAGSKYEVVSNAFGEIKRAVLDMDFEKAAQNAKTFAIAAKSITFGDAIKSVKELGQTFMTLGKALLTNPLFLIAAAVAGIVIALKKLMDELGLTKVVLDMIGRYFQMLMTPINILIDGLKELTDWFGITNNKGIEMAENQAKFSEDISKRLTESMNKAVAEFDRQIKLQEALGKSTDELQKNRLLLLVKMSEAEFKAAEDALKAAEIKKVATDEEIKKLKDKVDETKKTNLDLINEQKLLDINLQKVKDDAEKIAVDKKKENENKIKAEQEKEKQKEKKNATDRLNALRLEQDLEFSLMVEGIDKELKLNNIKYERLIEDVRLNENLIQSEKDSIIELYEKARAINELKIIDDNNKKDLEKEKENNEKKIELEKEKINIINEYKIAATKNEFEAEKIEREIAYNGELESLRVALENELITKAQFNEYEKIAKENFEKDITEIEKNEIEKRKLLREKENQQKIDGVLNGLQTIANLTELFSDKNKKAAKAAFEMNKGAQIAQTAIDTYKGAMSAYSAVASIPIVGPALGIAASAAVISAGLLNIKKISAQKFEGGNIDKTTPATPSYNGITMNAPVAPVPPSLSLFGTQMTGSSGGNEQGVGQRQQPIRAYVVENDITETQERLNLYKNRAEIG